MEKLPIRTAVEIMAKHNVILSHGAKIALESEEKFNSFVKEIMEQYNESLSNKKRLYRVFGEAVINSIVF